MSKSASKPLNHILKYYYSGFTAGWMFQVLRHIAWQRLVTKAAGCVALCVGAASPEASFGILGRWFTLVPSLDALLRPFPPLDPARAWDQRPQGLLVFAPRFERSVCFNARFFYALDLTAWGSCSRRPELSAACRT
ncbi:hypothetical protein NDU88_000960 [Pleurodeles waltl]|uniref:Uncharacterized protein n=1 Tax=Pleurodeles waltl TaxID=8319 RepID=A0AAV7WH06_PLEWA|nr:hypothetical protein NDU88_000960 [Pleurodeles waltl]